MACGEACANVVQHAYAAAPGDLELEASLDQGLIQMWVRDRGQWRAPSDRGGGWGLQLMRALTDTVDVDRTAGGPSSTSSAGSATHRTPPVTGRARITSEEHAHQCHARPRLR